MRRNRIILISISILFILLSILYYGNNVSFLAMSFGFPAMISLGYYIKLPKDIHSRLKMDSYYNKNANVSGELILKKDGVLPVFYGKFFFRIENLLTGEEEDFILDFSLFGKKEKSLKFDFKVKHAGVVFVTIQKAEIYSMLGCFKKEHGMKRVRSFMVLPESFEMDVTLNPVYCLHEEGEKTVQSRNGFDSGIYYGVREYRQGDSMKNIHWKLTGKTDEYLVKELGMPALLFPVLYLETNLKEKKAELIDVFIEIYVSLSLQLVEAGYKHTMCWYDDRKQEWIWHNIEEMSHLEEVFSLLLRTPFTQQEKAHFFRIPSEEWNQFGQIIILTNQMDRYVDAMSRPENMTMLYGRMKKDKTSVSDQIYPFGIQTYRKDLDKLYL